MLKRAGGPYRIPPPPITSPLIGRRRQRSPLRSSFYEPFDDDDYKDNEEEEDDIDDNDDDDDDAAALADFRNKMATLFGTATTDEAEAVDELIEFARASSTTGTARDRDDEECWAIPSTLQVGTVLLANPRYFCPDLVTTKPERYKIRPPSAALLAKFGLTVPPPPDLGADRRADLLPVLLVTELPPHTNVVRAVLLNRRTGYLLGDLSQARYTKFFIQPLWFGGVDAMDDDNGGHGLDMLHVCPHVNNAVRITDDGLYWGGDPEQAQTVMDTPLVDDHDTKQRPPRILTGFDFKFFVQHTSWKRRDLDHQIDAAQWYVARVSKNVLFQPRDRLGTRRAPPLWTEIMELLMVPTNDPDDEYGRVRNLLYNNDK